MLSMVLSMTSRPSWPAPHRAPDRLFSATLPIPSAACRPLYAQPAVVTIQREQVTVAAIEQRCYIVNGRDKLAALTRIFEMEESPRLIFVRTRAALRTGRRVERTRFSPPKPSTAT